MDDTDLIMLSLLLMLKRQHGDLNAALISTYFKCHPGASMAKAAKDCGVSRNAIRRVLKGVSEKDRAG